MNCPSSIFLIGYNILLTLIVNNIGIKINVISGVNDGGKTTFNGTTGLHDQGARASNSRTGPCLQITHFACPARRTKV